MEYVDKLIEAGPIGILALAVIFLLRGEISKLLQAPASPPQDRSEETAQAILAEHHKTNQLLSMVLAESRQMNHSISEIRIELARTRSS